MRANVPRADAEDGPNPATMGITFND